MLMSELIIKKRDGGSLATEEIDFIIDGYVSGEIPDYQMSAMMMAIYFSGMDLRETYDLTIAMVNSGETLDLSGISGIKADKHSTGGVGDKTSLVLCPMVAVQGIKMAKMSGRGLGHTGGTIDKLESFPGFTCDLTMERFLKIADKVGFAIAGQTQELDPADKQLYALRDVTGTVSSRPLIVSSIMSKKLAAGADIIVLDVKTGSGAFMKTEAEAFALAHEMVDVGKRAGTKTVAVVTDMDEPLGYAVGNALEVREAISVLRGEMGGELLELCLVLGGNLLVLSGLAYDETEARAMLEESIKNGSALEKLAEFVEAQGGDRRSVFDTDLLPAAPITHEVLSRQEGYVGAIEADKVGMASLILGGGRVTKDSVVDLAVGVVLRKKVAQRVEKGESIATIYARDMARIREAEELLLGSYAIVPEKPEMRPFICGVVS